MDEEVLDGPEYLLQQYFGYSSFRQGQKEIIEQILSKRDTLAIMPTGAGKSICYQIPAIAMDGITIVVSPLISLMKDQVQALNAAGVRTCYLNSSLNSAQIRKTLSNIQNNVYKIVYVAPERLLTPSFLQIAKTLDLAMVVCDEAHCISQWGQDFRPHYLDIPSFIAELPKRPVLAAFTATATDIVANDIIKLLNLSHPYRLTTGFDRPNLYFGVVKPRSKKTWIHNYLKKHKDQSGIIYCSTRKQVEELYEDLRQKGYKAGRYHAGLENDERAKMQEDFVFDKLNVIVATNAFGMGIDKSNVNYVIHYAIPGSMEAYYQEAGRAGRDGTDAECILLFSYQDVVTQEFFIEHKEKNPNIDLHMEKSLKQRDEDKLQIMVNYANCSTCKRQFILEYFKQKADGSCNNCSSCLKTYHQIDCTKEAQVLLSLIVRTHERYGATFLIDIVQGAKTRRILENHLNEQSTYGLLKNRSKEELYEILEALQREDYLGKNPDYTYPTLRLKKKGAVLLKSRAACILSLETAVGRSVTKSNEKVDEDLVDLLKNTRNKLAYEGHLPAYIICSNATLEDMARRKPKTKDELLLVSGMGEIKVKNYGQAFLNTLEAYENTNFSNAEESKSK